MDASSTASSLLEGQASTAGRSPGEIIAALDLRPASLRLRFERSGACSGLANMARDTTLLDEVCAANEPLLIVRTYLWGRPTLSLGKNQPEKDHQRLLAMFCQTAVESEQGFDQALQTPDLVKRPTGGRAILHHQDISFAFVTNAPVFLRLPLKDSYCVFTHWLKQTLLTLGYPTQSACKAGERDYLRSPLCFDTHTPSDILGPDGEKLAGCAQARRSRGILQHGSAFLGQTPQTLEPAFSEALFTSVAQAFGQSYP